MKIEAAYLYELYEKIEKRKIQNALNVSDSMWSKHKSTGPDHRNGWIDKEIIAAHFTYLEKMIAIKEGDIARQQLIEQVQDTHILMLSDEMGAGIYLPQRELRSRSIRHSLYTISQLMEYLAERRGDLG